MRIACVQVAFNESTPAACQAMAWELLGQATGHDLVLLGEMWPCGYFGFEHYATVAEPLDGPLMRQLSARARSLGAWLLAGSIPERDGERLYNTSVLFDQHGTLVAHYRKAHLFGYQSREPELLTPGNTPVVVDTPWGRAGLAICYDLRFPELFRLLVDQGASMFLVTSAWPRARLEAWRLFTRARAAENLALLVACNSAGVDHGQAYAGHSLVVAPTGNILAEAGEGAAIISAEYDPWQIAELRASFSALADRRFGITSPNQT